MIELIALDLDGTLLAPDETISAADRAAIRQALAMGIRVSLVTGRGTDMAIRVSDELSLHVPVICCHGALTKDFGADRTLVHMPVPLEYARPMVEYAEEQGLSIAIYLEELFWRLEGSRLFMDDMNGPTWRQVKSFRDVLHSAPTFIRFLGRESVAAMQAKFGDLPLNFRYETWFDFYECAVLNKDAGKQQALAQLCAQYRIPAKNVLAIGDSRNDVPMLQWAGIGVVMANALPEVLAAVPNHTGSNAQSGVAQALERFVFHPNAPAADGLAS